MKDTGVAVDEKWVRGSCRTLHLHFAELPLQALALGMSSSG